MTTPRLILMFGAWLLAAGAVAVTAAVVVTEIFVVVGLVDRSGSSYRLSLNIVTGVTFVALAAIPFVFKNRFRIGTDEGAAQA
jgi:membrane protein YdbS with pleckstrin-like domain